MLCRTQVLQSQIFHVFSFLYFFLSLCTCICADMALSVWVSSFSLLFIDVYRISVCMQVSFLCEKEYTKVDFSKCYVKCCSPRGTTVSLDTPAETLKSSNLQKPKSVFPIILNHILPTAVQTVGLFHRGVVCSTTEH